MQINELENNDIFEKITIKYNNVLNLLTKLFQDKVITEDEYYNISLGCCDTYSKEDDNIEKLNFYQSIENLLNKYADNKKINPESNSNLSIEFLKIYGKYSYDILIKYKSKGHLFLKNDFYKN